METQQGPSDWNMKRLSTVVSCGFQERLLLKCKDASGSLDQNFLKLSTITFNWLFCFGSFQITAVASKRQGVVRQEQPEPHLLVTISGGVPF